MAEKKDKREPDEEEFKIDMTPFDLDGLDVSKEVQKRRDELNKLFQEELKKDFAVGFTIDEEHGGRGGGVVRLDGTGGGGSAEPPKKKKKKHLKAERERASKLRIEPGSRNYLYVPESSVPVYGLTVEPPTSHQLPLNMNELVENVQPGSNSQPQANAKPKAKTCFNCPRKSQKVKVSPGNHDRHMLQPDTPGVEAEVPIVYKSEQQLHYCSPLQKCRLYIWIQTFMSGLFRDFIIAYFLLHYLLLYLAWMLAINGIQFIVLGVHQMVQVNYFLTSEVQTLDMWFKIIGGGILVLLVIPLLAGVLQDKIWLLFTYLAIGVFMLLAILFTGVWIRYDESETQVTATLHLFMTKYFLHGNYPDKVRAMDKIQNEFNCCGADNVSDYRQDLPNSCCFSKMAGYYTKAKYVELFGTYCDRNTSMHLITEGCSKHLQHYREAIQEPHIIFLTLAGFVLMSTFIFIACYVPLARRRSALFEDEQDDKVEQIDDPFRRTLLQTAILNEIDYELGEDEFRLREEGVVALAIFRERVNACTTMEGIHKLVAQLVDVTTLLAPSRTERRKQLRDLRLRAPAAENPNPSHAHDPEAALSSSESD